MYLQVAFRIPLTQAGRFPRSRGTVPSDTIQGPQGLGNWSILPGEGGGWWLWRLALRILYPIFPWGVEMDFIGARWEEKCQHEILWKRDKRQQWECGR